MYPTIQLSGHESGRELLELRRDRLREHRIRKASRMLGFAAPVNAAPTAEIIEFPSPEFPRIA